MDSCVSISVTLGVFLFLLSLAHIGDQLSVIAKHLDNILEQLKSRKL